MKKSKPILYILTIIIAGALVLFINGNYNKTTETKHPTPTPTKTIQNNTPKVNNSIMALNPKAPEVTDGEVIVKVSNNIISTSDNHNFSINNIKIKAPADECTVNKASEFCIAGIEDKNNFNIFFLKDALHSRLFENIKNFQKIMVTGSPASGTLDLELNGKIQKALVVTNSDSSGWILLFSDSYKNDINTLASNIKIS